MALSSYAIVCADEANRPLSNKRDLDSWAILLDLIRLLMPDPDQASSLFSWKSESPRIAGAKEPYAWRAALDEIKNSDLSIATKGIDGGAERKALAADKPTMLKIAGEITNSLLHSYTSRHKIAFVQYTEKVPP